MSEIEPRQEDLQKPLETPEAAPSESDDLEGCQSQLLSQESELSTTEVSIEPKIEQSAHLVIPTSNDEIEGVDKLLDDSSVQTPQEVLLVNPHDAKTSPSSQESPLALERIYQELKCMAESMRKFQTSVDSLREEVADLKQQIVTTNLKATQTNQKTKQAQSSSFNPKKLDNTQTRGKKLDFHPVAFLQQYGEEKFQEELEKKANTELIQIIRSEGIKSGKDLKNLEREDMIQDIILNTKRRLKQGSVFLKD